MMVNLFKTAITPEAIALATEVLQSGYVGQGHVVEEFESALKDVFRNPHVVTVNSATSALTLALRMFNLPQGTKVLTTPLTCSATNWAILANNLVPQWVDIDPSNLCFDYSDLSNKLTSETRVLMVVHWGGHPQSLDKIEEIRINYQNRFGQELFVLHDCAHAFGSMFNFEQLASYGRHYFAYSFGPVKTLSCVDGGCLVTPDVESYDRAKLLRWYGIDRENRSKDVTEFGFKYHMNNLNAAIGLANLPAVHHKLQKNHNNASNYTKHHFGDNRIAGFVVPKEEEEIQSSQSILHSSYYLYTVYVDRRNSFIPAMRSRGVECALPHLRNDHYSCVSQYRTKLPNLDSLYDKIICIPVGWWLSDDDVDVVCSSIKKGW